MACDGTALAFYTFNFPLHVQSFHSTNAPLFFNTNKNSEEPEKGDYSRINQTFPGKQHLSQETAGGGAMTAKRRGAVKLLTYF
jgi:hypothetical protein